MGPFGDGRRGVHGPPGCRKSSGRVWEARQETHSEHDGARGVGRPVYGVCRYRCGTVRYGRWEPGHCGVTNRLPRATDTPGTGLRDPRLPSCPRQNRDAPSRRAPTAKTKRLNVLQEGGRPTEVVVQTRQVGIHVMDVTGSSVEEGRLRAAGRGHSRVPDVPSEPGGRSQVAPDLPQGPFRHSTVYTTRTPAPPDDSHHE